MTSNERPLFTVITVVYCRFELMKQSLTAIREQSYKNLEIIVVNNGATAEITDYLLKAQSQDNRIKIVHFTENQYSDEDPMVTVRVCFNAALNQATGEYVFYQSDDDLMANDYVERMVNLFLENPDCISAAGLVEDIDESGHLLYQGLRPSNYRPRHMPGHILALNTLCGNKHGNIMFYAPGCIFTLKREALVKAGGYDEAIEWSQLYGIVPFGVTGFDEKAIFYWRRHKGQTNLYLSTIGFLAFHETLSLLKDWEIEKRWQVFGKDTASFVVRRIEEHIYAIATDWFCINFYYCRFKICGRILKDIWHKLYFWRRLPVSFWEQKIYIKYALKPLVRKIFESQPWLTKKFPKLLPLQERAFK